jgi:hypothetical protein
MYCNVVHKILPRPRAKDALVSQICGNKKNLVGQRWKKGAFMIDPGPPVGNASN